MCVYPLNDAHLKLAKQSSSYLYNKINKTLNMYPLFVRVAKLQTKK